MNYKMKKKTHTQTNTHTHKRTHTQTHTHTHTYTHTHTDLTHKKEKPFIQSDGKSRNKEELLDFSLPLFPALHTFRSSSFFFL